MINMERAERIIKQSRVNATSRFDVIRRTAITDFKNSLNKPAEELFDLAISLHQGMNTRRGIAFENEFFNLINAFFDFPVVYQQKDIHAIGAKRMDGVVLTPKRNHIFSVTMSTRERKESTWINEYEKAKEFSQEQGKEFMFYGIAYEKIVRGLNAKLVSKMPLGHYMSFQDMNSMKTILQWIQNDGPLEIMNSSIPKVKCHQQEKLL